MIMENRIRIGMKVIIIMMIDNIGFYVSECIDEPPSITPPATSKRLEYPRPFPVGFPHTS